jgi:rhodanese-related sulfurtransferase
MKNPIPILTRIRAVFFALIVILSIGFAGWLETTGSAGQAQEISARTLSEMMSSSTHLVIIDISTLGEYEEAHIKGSLRGDLGLIRTQPEKYLDSLGVKKSDTIILTCEIGNKSYRTVGILLKAGYLNVYNLAGGKIDWARSGYDLVVGDGKK